ncbi:MAG: aldehyde ferredoxin oxidoreductase [Deltaproteobacteria bacterium]|nr:MAG: aldehyde ferredoxin oxidoreductase [Deltaproteobacteria bacterium]
MRDHFRILLFDLAAGVSEIVRLDGRDTAVGGSGLAALLYGRYGQPNQPWNAPEQPLIFAIGPLTGYYPIMSKTVCAFKSSYHGQYTESHGGGRTALALFFAGFDALVIVGRAKRLSCLNITASRSYLQDVEFLRGRDADFTGKTMRKMLKIGSGHRSLLRIGQAGEIGSSMACINVDTYRHFGRMGGGASMGVKNLKGICIVGECGFTAPKNKEYNRVYKKVFDQLTATAMMKKYHNLGTAANVKKLNDIKSLPWNNLQKTTDPEVDGITGTAFAQKTLLRNAACGGCPVGCIHIGFIREKTGDEHRYHYHQTPYDYEPVFAAGSMLGVKNAFDVLRILDVMEKGCIDVMSGGVALAWATEATEKGLIDQRQTIVPLSFGDTEGYKQAAAHLCCGSNDFYRLLGQGSLKAAERYGGSEFACVLGQEMAGYATGELFFAAQSLGFRHSHLDTGAYSYDQKHSEQDVEAGVNFLMNDEPGRVFLTSMVACLFARSVYSNEQLAECLNALGYNKIASSACEVAEEIRKRRWQVRIATGFNPEKIEIPKRFYKVKTWKGLINPEYLDALKKEYGHRIMALAEDK